MRHLLRLNKYLRRYPRLLLYGFLAVLGSNVFAVLLPKFVGGAIDSIQKSTRHKSGFALRFPRIVRLRPDKRAEEADTLQTVVELYDRTAGR